MEKLIHQTDKTEIIIDVEDTDADQFLEECITLMKMLGYHEQSIKKALDEATV